MFQAVLCGFYPILGVRCLGYILCEVDLLKAIEISNHLAKVVRSKPHRPVYRGYRHITPLLGFFWAIRIPKLKGLNRLFYLL